MKKMELKNYIVYFTYITGENEFLYKKPFSNEKTGKTLEKSIKKYISDIECSSNKWNNDWLELDESLTVKLEYYQEISKQDYQVLIQYL